MSSVKPFENTQLSKKVFECQNWHEKHIKCQQACSSTLLEKRGAACKRIPDFVRLHEAAFQLYYQVWTLPKYLLYFHQSIMFDIWLLITTNTDCVSVVHAGKRGVGVSFQRNKGNLSCSCKWKCIFITLHIYIYNTTENKRDDHFIQQWP